MPPRFSLAPAQSPADFRAAAELIREYVAWLGVDLAFQGLDAELADLPVEYGPPRGTLLLARSAGEHAGVIALRPLLGDTGEVKRMYVRPRYRRCGLGRALLDAVLAAARERGYRALRLDTLAHMHDAIRLYEGAGFRRIAAYYDNPLPGATYFEKPLA